MADRRKRKRCEHCNEMLTPLVYKRHLELYYDKVRKCWIKDNTVFSSESELDSDQTCYSDDWENGRSIYSSAHHNSHLPAEITSLSARLTNSVIVEHICDRLRSHDCRAHDNTAKLPTYLSAYLQTLKRNFIFE